MRYQVKHLGGRYAVVDASFDNAVLCQTSSRERAEQIAAAYNESEQDAPAPHTLDTELANFRRELALSGDLSAEREMGEGERRSLRLATRGESYR